MQILKTSDALAAFRESAPGPVGLVPTMGALHAGHLALIAASRAVSATTVTSIFVNPTQFSPAENVAGYPRDEAGDLEKLAGAGCDAVWMPGAEAIYPPGDATMIEVAGPALEWEGRFRPGHFRGMATVVAKLFGHVRADTAWFGEKDWQQLQVVRRMVADLLLPIRIMSVPTVRELDGLAMSSRNRLLSAAERAQAPALFACLRRVAEELRVGADPEVAIGQGKEELARAGFAVDYLALVDAAALHPTTALDGARLLAAARLGSVRLLDNVGVG